MVVSTLAGIVFSAFFAVTDPAAHQGAIEDLRVEARATTLRERVAELAGTGDLLENLHFEWFDRPYARATLAVLAKTTKVLDREIDLRGLANGAISDASLVSMVSWAEGAVQRVLLPEPHAGFRPHRMRTRPADLLTPTVAPPLFGFVDDATATRHDRRFGDLDLLVAAGWRVYARSAAGLQAANTDGTLFDRADAVGVLVVGVEAPAQALPGGGGTAASTLPGQSSLLLRPITLRAAMQSVPSLPSSQVAIALVDSPLRESPGGWLARRGLGRGLRGGARYLIDFWQAPAFGEAPENRAAAASAAMWIDAIEGQSLGLLHGWRDLRDGSGSLCASVLVEPWYVETVARTSLDLMRLSSHLRRFDGSAMLAVAVGPEAVDGGNGNAWAAWTEPLWESLLRGQVRFDVVSSGGRTAGEPGERYRAVLPVGPAEVNDREELAARIERALSSDSDYANRMRATESDGSPANDLFLREARTPDHKPCVALVNLADRPRTLRLRGKPPLRAVKDLIADELIRTPEKLVRMAPWQVRLLCVEQ